MRTPLAASAALMSLVSGASAEDLMDCTEKALNQWVGAWRCDTHYLDAEDWRFKTVIIDDRLEATEAGLTQYVVEEGKERMNFTIAFGEAQIIYQNVSPTGEQSGSPRMQEVMSCSGPDEHGFYTVHVRFRPNEEAFVRGTLIASAYSTRNAWEWSRDGENWMWGRQEVCVRSDLDEES